MGGILGQALSFLLKNEVVRSFAASVGWRILASFIHSRADDPEFRAQLTTAFTQLASASTEKERMDASRALFNLDGSVSK
jgi:hypothetical protein